MLSTHYTKIQETPILIFDIVLKIGDIEEYVQRINEDSVFKNDIFSKGIEAIQKNTSTLIKYAHTDYHITPDMFIISQNHSFGKTTFKLSNNEKNREIFIEFLTNLQICTDECTKQTFIKDNNYSIKRILDSLQEAKKETDEIGKINGLLTSPNFKELIGFYKSQIDQHQID